MDWSFIVTWIKKTWQKFVDSLGTEVKPVPPVVVVDSPVILDPPPDPPPGDTGVIVVWDGDLIPGMMQAQGWTGNGSEVYWALFCTYGSHEWGYKGDGNESPTARELYAQRDKIYKWYFWYVVGIGKVLQANPSMTALLIKNDANDLGGCFMHQPIRDQLEGMGISGTRLTTGDVFIL